MVANSLYINTNIFNITYFSFGFRIHYMKNEIYSISGLNNVDYHIMAGPAFVVAKEGLIMLNGNILTLW